MTTFAEKLKLLREEAGMTQAQLSLRAGLSLGIVRDYEQGRKEPALRSAFKLADALGVSCEVFRDCIESAPPEKPARGKGKAAGEQAAQGKPAGKGRGRKGKGE